MHARVWQLRVKPGKLAEFRAALLSLSAPARQQPGFRGSVAIGSGKPDAPEVTVVAVWDSLEALRASERNLFLMQAISRVICCSEGFPQITEHEILANDLFLEEGTRG